MKKIFSFFAAAIVAVSVFAQTPEKLYILGDINGIGWNPGAPGEMTKDGDTFTGKYTFTNDLSYFAFTTVQGSWDDVNANRWGTTAQVTTEAAATLTKGGDGTCATIAKGTYTITVDWAAQTVTAVVAQPDGPTAAPDHLYTMGNIEGVDWEPTKMVELTKSGDKFSATLTFVGEGTSWFAFFTVGDNDWEKLNANRYGTSALITTEAAATLIKGGDGTCATIAPGTYTITVDWANSSVSAEAATTAVENVETSVKATKRIVNGQLVIVRGENIYNLTGAAL